MSAETKELYEFGGLRLDAVRRVLTRGETPVPLTSKALETLLLLVRQRSRVVTKDELMQALWPETFVEEVNLAQNVSAVRRALGETPGENRYIATIPGKGYQFVCTVHSREEDAAGEPASSPGTTPTGKDEATAPAGPVRSPRRTWWLAGGAVAAVLAAGVGSGLYLEHHRAEAAEGAGHSVAVLPFQPLVAGGDEEHLGLGMADAVITKLSNVRQLPVRPTDVAIRYADPHVDVLKAAREMGVDTVLTSKIQRVGERVRVTVQLVRASDGRPLWAESFDERYTNIFAVEDSISEKVVGALAVQVGGQERLEMERHATENIDAYRNYLKGRYAEFTFTRQGMNDAIADFDQAIANDPGYALAYAGLADAYTTESDWLLPPREALPRAESAARKALVFDPNLAEAHGALAHALLHEWRLAEADQEFHRALALNPGNVSTYFAYSEYLASVGQADQAIATMNQALRIDPLSPEINSFLAWDFYMKRDYGQCLNSAGKAEQMFPDFWLPPMVEGACRTMRGEYPAATAALRKALAMNPEATAAWSLLAVAQARSGQRAAAVQSLAQLQALAPKTYVSPVYVGLVWLALGDRDQAYVWMEKGYEDQAEWLLWLPLDPMFDGERQDARYQALMRKVGLAV